MNGADDVDGMISVCARVCVIVPLSGLSFFMGTKAHEVKCHFWCPDKGGGEMK